MKFVIQGRLDGLNEYTKACRGNKYGGNTMKKKNEQKVFLALLESIERGVLRKVDKYPIKLEIVWYEPNSRRDIDNIVAGTKFIQDAMVKKGIIEDDSQKYINTVRHTVKVDKDNPRIEVSIIE